MKTTKSRMNRDQLYQWVADNHLIDPDSEGDKDQALMSGWINAMDMQDAGLIKNEAEFIDYAYSCYDSMGYT